jgi:hypoxanthine phosphoribosyltransferase
MNDPVPMIDEAAIARRIETLADEITAAMPEPFIIVCILNGAFMFTADLSRALARRGHHPTLEFVNLKSYGNETESSGQVRMVGSLPESLAEKRVLLVDDILDSGRTLQFAKALLTGLGAIVVRLCVFLDKPARRVVPIEADHVGFKIEDRFVVGYGLDYAKRWRGLPHLATLD